MTCASLSSYLGDLLLFRRTDNVVEGDGDAGPRCAVEADILQGLSSRSAHVIGGERVAMSSTILDSCFLPPLRSRTGSRQAGLVEQDTAVGGGEQGGAVVETLSLTRIRPSRDLLCLSLRHTKSCGRRISTLIGACMSTRAWSRAILASASEENTRRPWPWWRRSTITRHGQEVQTGDHVQAWHGQRLTRRRRQDVVRTPASGSGPRPGLLRTAAGGLPSGHRRSRR